MVSATGFAVFAQVDVAIRMLIWIVFAVMTAAAVLAVLIPLSRVRQEARDAADSSSNDVRVYKDQLVEIESDLGRGLIGAREADAARTEVARRLLAAEARDRDAITESGLPRWRRGAALVSIIAVPVIALLIYLPIGAPNLPGQPLAQRFERAVEDQDIAALVRRVEQVLADNPEDGRGWDVLGPVYARLGRYEDAARAFRNAIRILGATVEREAGLGMSLVAQSDGVVTEMARQAFERARLIDPQAVQPRFYLALAAEQDGDNSTAIELWRSILTMSDPAGQEWRQVAEQRVAALTAVAPAIDEDEMAAVREMAPEDRQVFIEDMVGRLAARLADDDQDLTGWLRLTNAYVMLGREDDARTALAQARAAFDGDDEALAELDRLAASLGIGS
ncbi:MAG: c-type cytochrome biogenesis protein CcmI [Pseudomonadota bacterium]